MIQRDTPATDGYLSKSYVERNLLRFTALRIFSSTGVRSAMYSSDNTGLIRSVTSPNFVGPVICVHHVSKETMLSPVLAFCSGPGFEEEPSDILQSDDIYSPDCDSSSEMGIQEESKFSLEKNILDKKPVSPEDEDDTILTVSEVSNCSSVLSTDVESREVKPCSPKSCRKIEPFNVPSPVIKTSVFEGHGQSSSEPEDEETARKVSGRMSKRLSELFSFSGGVNASGDENVNELRVEKKRRGSFSRKISPALSQVKSAVFHVGPKDLTNIPKTPDKLEPEKEKEPIKVRTPRAGRKLSLTMFKGANTASKSEETPKRRNTDPVVDSKQRTSTIFERDEARFKGIMKVSSCDNPEKVKCFTGEIKPQRNEIEPEFAHFKEEDIKIRDLMEEVLRAHLLHMSSYRREACDRAGRNICAVIKSLIEAMKETDDIDTKVVCLVYIGAVRDEGIFMSAQALWNSDQDNFAAASFRNDSVYGMAICIITPLY